jgi:hypothetical protein
LEEQDSSNDVIDSCLYNIVDGDELKIEPVNVTTVCVDENASTDKEIVNNDSKKSDVITNNLNGSLNSYQGSTTNNVCIYYIYILKP